MTYILWIAVNKDIKICVGSLGKIHFKRGYYLYVGSAKRGIKARIKRHLSKNKKIFWHIDYLFSSNKVKIKNIWISVEKQECRIAKGLRQKGYDFVDKFGSSDCQCKSHLFFINKDDMRIRILLKKNGFRNASKNYF